MDTRKTFVLVALVGLAVVGAAAAYACATCGCSAPKPAQVAVTRPFTVHDVTGAVKGQDTCYICRNGGKPTLILFARRTDGHLRHLAPAVDQFVADNKGKDVRAFVVLLDANTQANRDKLAALAREHKLSIPLTIAADGVKGPKPYNLPASFDTRVVVANRNKVLNTIDVNCAKSACGCTKCARVNDVAEAGKALLGSI